MEEPARGVNRGIAYEADILVVKMKSPAGVSKPQSAQMMMAVDFAAKWRQKEDSLWL